MSIPEHELDRLAVSVTGRDRASRALDPPSERDSEMIAALATRRRQGVPLQYLEGSAAFGPLDLLVDERVLIPRPETERVWEEAVTSLGRAGPGTVIVDVGTGSGALALALKHTFPDARVLGVDVSAEALAVAEQNATRLGLDVEFLEGDLFAPLPQRLQGRVDLIVTNPPYVSTSDFESLPDEVRDHEPRVALVAGEKGTEVLERIAGEAYWWLGIGGWVVAEIGETQGDEAHALFYAFDREVRQDLTGRDRVLVARKGASCCV